MALVVFKLLDVAGSSRLAHEAKAASFLPMKGSRRGQQGDRSGFSQGRPHSSAPEKMRAE